MFLRARSFGRSGCCRLRALAGGALVAALLLPPAAQGQETLVRDTTIPRFPVPAWAYPMPATLPAVNRDSMIRLQVPRSAATFTSAQLHDRHFAPDWFPGSHAPMPEVVARGRKPAVIACGYCHLPDGAGRPENAMLAGLPAIYMMTQLQDMRGRDRQSAWRAPYLSYDLMQATADSATEEELAAAVAYFAKLRPRRRATVIESAEVPKTVLGIGIYLPDPAGGTEPLGQRLIEMPVDAERHERRDPQVPYVAYVPKGSLALGKRLATVAARDGGLACASCHGSALRGSATAPPIAGRSPSYLLRQLLAFRTGTRMPSMSTAMPVAAASMTLEEMIAAAAYVASRTP